MDYILVKCRDCDKYYTTLSTRLTQPNRWATLSRLGPATLTTLSCPTFVQLSADTHHSVLTLHTVHSRKDQLRLHQEEREKQVSPSHARITLQIHNLARSTMNESLHTATVLKVTLFNVRPEEGIMGRIFMTVYSAQCAFCWSNKDRRHGWYRFSFSQFYLLMTHSISVAVCRNPGVECLAMYDRLHYLTQWSRICKFTWVG